MWYQSFEFYDKQHPAAAGDMAAFRAPLPEAERADALRCLEAYAAQLDATAFCLPPHFSIPKELAQLWQYSVSGGIVGNGQDFGYFLPAEVVSFYFAYQFWHYAPNLMPIAFDGGGIFYCYDFRPHQAASGHPPPVVMNDSGNLGETVDEIIWAGNTLAEVLAKKLGY
ncbi:MULTISPECIES: SMI1/KNR4 family protein [Eikenella]|uniref:Knr4/Smi1-like domain-containing protein n=1 Tax=Eikenella longinqua TaxID=1795827 RepID=A0A1A9RUK1_9NEIS|nr:MULTISPECIES: SMI1/KNR4 family protein [Eikenella]OAM26710.1 hypothetical protein A7P95_08075 [Eikenella longinqua]